MKKLIKKIVLIFVLSFVIWGNVLAEPDFWTKWESYNYKRCIGKNDLPKANMDTCKCVAAMFLKTDYADKTRGGHIGSVKADYLQTLESKLILNSICVISNSPGNGFTEVKLEKDNYKESKFIKLKNPKDYSFFCTLAGYPRCEGFKWNCGMVKGYESTLCSGEKTCPDDEYWDDAYEMCMSSDSRINVDWKKDAKDPEGDKDNDQVPNIADKDNPDNKEEADTDGDGIIDKYDKSPYMAAPSKNPSRDINEEKVKKDSAEKRNQDNTSGSEKENTTQEQDNSVTTQIKTMSLDDYQRTRCNGNNKNGLVRYDPLCDDKNIAKGQNGGGRTGTKNATTEFMTTLDRILDWLVRIVLLVGVGVIVWSGFLYVISAADPKKKEEAKKKINTVLIGWFFVLAAFLIVQLILNTFAIGGVDGKYSGLDKDKTLDARDRQPLK